MAIAFRAGSALNRAQTLTSTNTQNLTITQATLTGSCLIVANASTTRTVSSITDSQGNVWRRLNSNANGTSANAELWGCNNAIALAVNNTITITMSANGRFTSDFGEYTGVIGGFANAFDNTGSTSPTTTGAQTVRENGNFLIAAFALGANNTWTAQNGSIRGQIGTTSLHGALVDNTGSTSLTDSATMTAANWATAAVDVLLLPTQRRTLNPLGTRMGSRAGGQ